METFRRVRKSTTFYLDLTLRERLFQRAHDYHCATTRLAERYIIEGLLRDEMRDQHDRMRRNAVPS